MIFKEVGLSHIWRGKEHDIQGGRTVTYSMQQGALQTSMRHSCVAVAVPATHWGRQGNFIFKEVSHMATCFE
jgi:hypothetical protein